MSADSSSVQAPRVRTAWGRRLASRGHERGAALVEAAIVLPVLITILLGVIEVGFIFKDSLTISSAVRAGARIGAVDGTNTLSDYDILMAVKSGSSALPSNAIQAVVVYKASTTSSALPTGCSSGSTSSCNYYTGTFVQSAFTSASFGCGTGSVDSNWCPTARLNHQSDPPDYVGVYIKINHSYFTGFFGAGPKVMTDKAVLRIEPTDA